MKSLATLLLLLTISARTFAQTINFVDNELKQYLINEPCANTNSFPIWQGQFDVDINNDGEIQVSEALSIKYLDISDDSNNYAIQSLNDLVNFTRLVTLDLGVPINFDQIQLDSLKNFYAIDLGGITKIDISNLPNLSDTIRIEGIITLDTLNIKNGSSANSFSLFYTQHIKYACVDSIADEYNAFGVFGAMASDGILSTTCEALNNIDELNQGYEISFFPNPTNGIIELKEQIVIDKLFIMNSTGEIVYQKNNANGSIDISPLSSGIYFMKIKVGESMTVKKVIKN